MYHQFGQNLGIGSEDKSADKAEYHDLGQTGDLSLVKIHPTAT